MNRLRTLMLRKGIGFILPLIVFGLVSVPSAHAGGGGGTFGPFSIPLPPPEIATTSVTVTIVAPPAVSSVGTYTQSFQDPSTLYYAWNRWLGYAPSSDIQVQGYQQALNGINVTIAHSLGIYDHTTGTLIPQGGHVTQNQVIDLKFQPFAAHEISWFGTGYSMDSPYGNWNANANPPARVGTAVTCNADDFVETTQVTGIASFDVYAPYEVNPPVRTITTPAGLSGCSVLTTNPDTSAVMTCTVTGSGTSTPSFNFASSFSKFYYRYHDPRNMSPNGGPGCYGNNIPLTVVASGGPGAPQPGYSLTVPAMAVPYTIVASASANVPPSTPTLTCPAGPINVNTSTSFTVKSTDPNGDQIRYGFDWAGSGSVNAWAPVAGYTAGGVNYSTSHSWASPGTYAVKVLAQDSNGANSSWSAPCNVTVVNPVVNITGVTCSVPTATAAVGTPFTWTASGATGGNGGPYTYTWHFTGATAKEGGTGTSITVSDFKAGGPYSGSVTATDSAGGTSGSVACAGTATLTSGGAFTPVCTVTPTTGQVNITTFVFSLDGTTGGTPPYTCPSGNWKKQGPLTIASSTLSNVGGNTTCDNAVVYSSTGNGAGWKVDIQDAPNANRQGGFNCPVANVVAALPDLTAGLVSAGPSPVAGVPTTLSALISNSNVLTTGAPFTDLFQVANDSSGTGAVDISPTYANATLIAGQSVTASIPYTFDTPGTYYVRACADKSSAADTGVITESLEDNNCSTGNTWTQVVVSAPPSPAISSCTPSSPSVSAGTNVTWTPNFSNFTQAPNSFTWSVGNGNPSSGSASTFTSKFVAAGSYSPHLLAANTNTNETAQADCTPVTVTGAVCGGAPTPTITASQTRVISGNTVHLSWTANNVTTQCVILNETTGTTVAVTPGVVCSANGGSIPDPTITTQTTFSITCDNNAATKQTITINVVPKIIEF